VLAAYLRNLTAVFRLHSTNSEVSNHKAVHIYNTSNNDPIQFSVSVFHSRDPNNEAHDRIGYERDVLLYSVFKYSLFMSCRRPYLQKQVK